MKKIDPVTFEQWREKYHLARSDLLLQQLTWQLSFNAVIEMLDKIS